MFTAHLRDIFDVFVQLRRMTLWPWPLTFWPWECFSCPTHTNFYYPTIIGYWVMYYSVIRHSHCACAVSRDLSFRGGGNGPRSWNPWHQFTYSLCHFQGATVKI